MAASAAARGRGALVVFSGYTTTFDDDGALLDQVARTHQGLVVAGFGAGHVPAALSPVLGKLAATMPVVMTSRTGAGPVLSATYGAMGSGRDLQKLGLINGGFAHPYKARVLLRLLAAHRASVNAIAGAFAESGKPGNTRPDYLGASGR